MNLQFQASMNNLKELHGKARECYLVWKDVGRPRTMVSHQGHNCISSALTNLDSALTS